MGEYKRNMIVYSASAGTGKTYTLAARYIALLMDTAGDRGYRHVLAVTFTNKATAEMKQRILGQLYAISKVNGKLMGSKREDNGTLAFMETIRKFMRRKMDDEHMAAKAQRLCRNILEDYDNMQVQTIDAFLHQLITGMAHTLGIGADFGVELDSNHVISAAVDEVMNKSPLPSTKEEEKNSQFHYLVDYVEERLDDEKSWDVRKDLIAMTKELLKEAVLKDENAIVLDPDKIRRYKRAINWRQAPEVPRVRALYNKVRDCEANGEIANAKNYNAFIRRVGASLEGTAGAEHAFRGLGEKDANALAKPAFLKKISTRPEEIQQVLMELQEECVACRKAYLSDTITARYLNDLAMMGFVKEHIDRNLLEANTILLARTAYVLHEALKPGDADFILEKAGIRYNHIMIDEFQDTSTLQWAVFRELISEILGSGGTTLIVGDVKQSIYRWRNGDYRIMQGLMAAGEENKNGTASERTGDDSILNYVQTEPLRKNYRSQAMVVDFNLRLFDWLCAEGGYAHDFADIYRELSTGWSLADYCNKAGDAAGYVQVSTRLYSRSKSDKPDEPPTRGEVRAGIVQDMLGEIADLVERGAAMSDIMILIRFNGEAKEIIEQYAKSGLEASGIRLCSNDSFLLDSSWSVQAIVNALKVICDGDKMARTFLIMCGLPTEELSGALMRLPLSEMVERVIRLTLLDADGHLRYNDQAYLNAFVDEVAAFVSAYGSDVKDFLRYWDDQLHKKAIPASGSDGVRIMTIHTAKGLESKYVFIPFCDWELTKDRPGSVLWHEAMCRPYDGEGTPMLGLIPAAQKKEMTETAYSAAYNDEHQAQRVDNLNLLYVALTRAADQLYVYASVSKAAKPKEPSTVGELLRSYVGEEMFCAGRTEIIADNKKDTSSPFEYRFKDEDAVAYSFRSSDEAIRFRQSQESLAYMQLGTEGVERAAGRINAGNLRHDIFAHINTMADTAKVVEQFYGRGLIETRREVATITRELEQAWRNPQMADWFGGGWQVLREVGILRPKQEYDAEVAAWRALPAEERGQMPKRELRPDRVMVREGRAVVLDFKFGKHNHAKYSRQVRQYMDLLRQMGYADVEGYLWYGFDGELVKI